MELLAPIIGLFFSSRPSAVSRLIVARIINTINRQSSRARSHIAQKCFKRIGPLFAHSNSAPAVAVPFWNVRVVAPAFHCRPYAIFRRHCSPFSKSMSRRPCSAQLTIQTSAALSQSSAQSVHSQDCRVPTITSASPKGMATVPFNKKTNSQLTESLAGNILRLFHGII